MTDITIELTGTRMLGGLGIHTAARCTVELPDYTMNELIDAIDETDGIDDFYQK